MTILAVTGLRAEARLAASAGLRTVCAGGMPDRTAAALDAALGGGDVHGIISFGIAGGIAPDLPHGTVIVADAVVTEDARFAVDGRWAGAVRFRTGGTAGDVAGSREIIATAVAKEALHRRTGALAVDLESAVVARAAGRAGLPFIVLRAIADPALQDLPPAAVLPLGADGRAELRRVAASLLRHPAQIGALVRIANDARAALRSLRRGLSLADAALDPRSVAV